MGLLSFFKRFSPASSAAGPAISEDSVEQARVRARHRLIGAAILVLIGVVGFPILFETQPRPIPVDLPIEIPRKDAAGPLPAPAPKPVPKAVTMAPNAEPAVITESMADAGREVPPPASQQGRTAVPAQETITSPPQPEAKPADNKPNRSASSEKLQAGKPATDKSVTEKPAKAEVNKLKDTDAARAQALLEGKEDAKVEANGRFVIQVGAFGEAESARDARQKVEKLGLKTYTQVVDTGAGKRIRVRVGPFASRDEAERAAGKIRAAGLPSALLTL